MDLEVSLDAGADFADLFEVKDKLEKKGTSYVDADQHGTLTLGYQRDSFVRETRITADKQARDPQGRLPVPRPPGAALGVDGRDRRGGVGRADAEAEREGNGRAAALAPAALDKDVEEWVAGGAAAVCSWDRSPCTHLPPQPGRPGGAAVPDAAVPGGAAGGGAAVVHGDVRPRQPDHQLPGAAVRARAGRDDAADAGAVPGPGSSDRSATRSRARSCTSCGSAR